MPMNRRQFMKVAAGTTLFGVLRGGRFAEAASDPGVLWAQVVADGGMDSVLWCDPKTGLRDALTNTHIVTAPGGNIPYCSLDPTVKAFMEANSQRMLVLNGVDTGTNNHEVGLRFSMSGSSNTGYPTFAAQVAAVYGEGKPMPLMAVSGYDETGELFAPTRLDWHNIGILNDLKHPNSRQFLSENTRGAMLAAHKARQARLAAANKLPGPAASLTQLRQARDATAALGTLEDANGSAEEDVIELGIKAFKKGLSVSMTSALGGFDTHAGTGGDATQLLRFGELCARVQFIMDKATENGVPVVVVVNSDFGRSPNHDGGDGTDHWPNSSVVIVQNDLAKARNLLPTNQVIGASTPDLQPMKVNASTLGTDSNGIIVTPGHVHRALRRAAKIDGATQLARFPLAISSADLTLG